MVSFYLFFGIPPLAIWELKLFELQGGFSLGSCLHGTGKYFIYMGIVSRDSFACLKTENILFTMELSALGYLCVFLTACSPFTSVLSLLLFWTSGFFLWGDPGGVVILSSLSLDVASKVGSGMPVTSSVMSIVWITSTCSATVCSDTSVSVSSVGSTRMACEIPVFSVSPASSVISLGTAYSTAISEFSLCSYLGSASSEISGFSLGTVSSATISAFSLCSYLGSSVSVVFVSPLVCVALRASPVSVTTDLIFSVVFTSVLGSCTVPKSRAAVDYTLTGIEPHGPSRSV